MTSTATLRNRDWCRARYTSVHSASPPFSWRRKWAACWNEVKYCSERCRRHPSRVHPSRV
ncbi:DUF2256 domain-containing protein [Lamprobacter modestohalophilus]|uniref:DUF2256 domain-containing protein n=1 Tax=Lamprobacter modestohalophilus TaxID=1064514 RepID=UPI002ADECF7A|nr:DUF2256 domain-containing protein [Lamprobacter modestohalophilus]MEA1049081.1 DUF2256 domain-containing protein [Lamprobacter modestohalophilus]